MSVTVHSTSITDWSSIFQHNGYMDFNGPNDPLLRESTVLSDRSTTCYSVQHKVTELSTLLMCGTTSFPPNKMRVQSLSETDIPQFMTLICTGLLAFHGSTRKPYGNNNFLFVKQCRGGICNSFYSIESIQYISSVQHSYHYLEKATGKQTAFMKLSTV